MDNDIEKLEEILDIVSERVPALLKNLRNLVYSKEAGKEFGSGVASFYKELIDGGIPAEQAMEMTRGYMVDLRALIDLAKNESQCGTRNTEKTGKTTKKGKKKGFTITINDKDISTNDDDENEEEERETEQDQS